VYGWQRWLRARFDRPGSRRFDFIVERDVRERVGARSSAPLKQLAQMVLKSAASELSIRRAAAAIGVAHDTATLYLEAPEGAYMVLSCPFFAWSERERAARPRKYYPIDTGPRRSLVTRAGDDVGKHLECATFLALRRRFRDVYYWRGRGEVDFVVLDEGRPRPILVSVDERIRSPGNLHRKGGDCPGSVSPLRETGGAAALARGALRSRP